MQQVALMASTASLRLGHLGRQCWLALGTWPELAAIPVTPVSRDQVWPSSGRKAAGGVIDWAQQPVWDAGTGPGEVPGLPTCWFLLASWVPAVGQGRAHVASQTPPLAFANPAPVPDILHPSPSFCLSKDQLRPMSPRKPLHHWAFTVSSPLSAV